MRTLLLTMLIAVHAMCHAQADTALTVASSAPGCKLDRVSNRLGNQYAGISNALKKRSLHALRSLRRLESRFRRQVAEKDSVVAAMLFSGADNTYGQLQAALNASIVSLSARPLKDYLPGLDSVQTALQFLQSPPLSGLSSATLPGITSTTLPGLQSATTNLTNLEARLQEAGNISAFLQQRQQALQELLSKYDLTSRLAGFKQQVYYYQSQIQQYKELLHDPDALARKLLAGLRQLPAFQRFFQTNSYLATLFRLPGNSTITGQPIPGLQTRDQVTTIIAERLGAGGSFPSSTAAGGNTSGNPLSAGMQQAQDQLDNLKNKISQYGGNGSSNVIPDFHPNSQHNKTFLQRIKLGLDLQTRQSSGMLPALSTIGLNIGYQLDDRHAAGIGASYLLGLGQPFSHISLSSQGAGLRSFLNWKIKGGYWISGGYEANYFSAFTHFSQLRNFNAWQQSGLIGLMKTYKSGKRSGNLQLLYDMLYRSHVPQSQPVVFRVGYSLN